MLAGELSASALRIRCLRLLLPSPFPSSRRRVLLRFCRRFTTTGCAATAAARKDKVIVISGPTGAGKSRLALELAKQLQGEIISADSVQVYRGLDVGSAKPSKSERQEVPHHLVDILNPSDDYSVGKFFRDARQVTQDILNRGRVPIVVGGTGLYLRWYVYGKPDVPQASIEVASQVYSELAELERSDDWDAAVQLVVKAGDPKAQDLATNDWYRLRRSLEIIKASGLPPSAFQVPYDSFKEQSISNSTSNSSIDGSSKDVNSNDLDYEFNCFFLSSPRLDLYRSIDYRCEVMLSESPGFLLEAKMLLDMGLLPNSNSATRAIGYRQAMEYLLSCKHQGGRSSPGEFHAFLADFQKASRNFAKRQMTWFRNERIYHWLDASKPMERVLNFVHDAYHDHSKNLIVPESLGMPRDASSRQELAELKKYRARNRHFVNRDACYDIIEWMTQTQSESMVSLSERKEARSGRRRRKRKPIIHSMDSALGYYLLPFLLIVVAGVWLTSRKRKNNNQKKKLAPPGPWQLPFIGNLHQLVLLSITTHLPPHEVVRRLAREHGPVMRLRLGEVTTVYLSSARAAEQAMKVHDVACATRPFSAVGEIIHYGCKNLVFLPYGEEWRRLRKLCVVELLSARRVMSFRSIRMEEVSNLVTRLETTSQQKERGHQSVDLKPLLLSLANVITSRSAFGMDSSRELNEEFVRIVEGVMGLFGAFGLSKMFPSLKFLPIISGFRSRVMALHRAVDSVLNEVIRQHMVARTRKVHGDDATEDLVDILLNIQQNNADQAFPLTMDSVKAVLLDIFIGGTDSTAVTIEWAMSEMMKNPSVMARAQTEVRSVFPDRVSEEGLSELVYLNAVINETLRLHPPGPMLPRQNQEKLEIDGYEIPTKTPIMVNVWAIGRDPSYWPEAEKFDPDRFLGSSIDYRGTHFTFLPFGAGRRMCPGIQFGMVTVQLALANLLFHFDWKLPHGMKPEDLDMREVFKIGLKRKQNLCLIPVPVASRN
ncbi:unnamed protein product [Linum trigynum]|uniref:Uncharacterized protein n=1 Tax=Linum trigynum TaxID=586398 RepID=A0AAV2EKN6_9ROSI